MFVEVSRAPLVCSFLVLTSLLVGGCLASPEIVDTVTPAPTAGGSPSYEGTYGAWQRHTRGVVGEDLFGAPMGGKRSVVFSSNCHGPYHKLYLRTENDSTLRRLTHGPGHDFHAAPDPESRRIAFTSTRDGGPRLYLLNDLDTPSAQRLGDHAVDAVHPSWSRDGRRIVYSRRSPVTGEWEIWLLDLAAGGQQRFITDGLFAEFHPTEERIVFQRARQRDRNWFAIWTIELDGSREREIIAGRNWGAVNPCWSPDGEWIAFNTVGKSAASRELTGQGDDIWCVRADGEFPTRLTFRDTPEWNPAWGRDGRIYFCSVQEQETAVWSLEPTGLPSD